MGIAKAAERKHKQLIVEGEQLVPTPSPSPSQSIAWQDKKHPVKVMVGLVQASGRRYAIDRDGKRYRWFCTTDGASSLHDFEDLAQAQAGAQGAEYEWVKAQGGKPAGTTSTELRAQQDPKARVLGDVKAPTGNFEEQLAEQMGWTKKNPATGTPVPLEASPEKPFPPSKGVEKMKLDMLFESPHNPRQVFREIHSLAMSIKATGGLLQPIVVRPHFNGPHPAYEIAAGARRFRALQLLKDQGVELDALVDVRELSDAQMAEAMMAENDQRDGLLPLEQAVGYSNMLKAGWTIDSAAEQLGVSTGTVRGRLALMNLGKKAGKMVLAGTMPSAVATKIAQYPEALQDDALQQMVDGEEHAVEEYGERRPLIDYETGEINARLAIDWLQKNFTRSLKSTAFDQKAEDLVVDQSIWPDRPLAGDEQVSAPSCAKCPRNSKNMPKELAGEDPSGEKRFGFCTLPTCFTAKMEAAAAEIEAKAKEQGLKMLSSQQVWKELRDGSQNLPHSSTFVKLDSIAPADSKKRTYRQVIAEAASATQDKEKPTVHVAITEKAGRVDLVKATEALSFLAAGEVGWAKDELKAKKKKAAGRSSSGPSAAQQAKEGMKHQAREKVRETVYRKIVERYRLQGPDLDAVRAMIGRYDDEGPVSPEELFGFKTSKELDAWVEKKATMPELLAVLYAKFMGQEFMGSWRSQGYDEEIERAAKVVKVETTKLEKHEFEALQRAAELANAAAAITWTTKGRLTEGKGKSGHRYEIREEKATSQEAKKKGLKTWFCSDWKSKGGALLGGSSPHDTLEIAKAACYSHEARS